MDLYQVLIRPVLTEKSEKLRQQGVYVFEVHPKANKILIKKAVEKIYGVKPRKVNISYKKRKRKRSLTRRFEEGWTSLVKKAYIYLPPEKKDAIKIFEEG